MSSRPEAWTPAPGTTAHRLLERLTEDPKAVTLPGISSVELCVARGRLKRAGYLVVTHVTARPALVSITRDGQAALSRSGTQFLLLEAHILVIVAVRAMTTVEVVAAVAERFRPTWREYVWLTCNNLAQQELLTVERASRGRRTTRWSITALGEFSLPDARKRLNLPPEAP